MTVDQASKLKPGQQFKATDNIWDDPLFTVTEVTGSTVRCDSSTSVGKPEYGFDELEGFSVVKAK